MSDTVFVGGLVLHAICGVMRQEAKVGQVFRLDLILDIDPAASSRSDRLKDTVSYDTRTPRSIAATIFALSASRSMNRMLRLPRPSRI